MSTRQEASQGHSTGGGECVWGGGGDGERGVTLTKATLRPSPFTHLIVIGVLVIVIVIVIVVAVVVFCLA
jgi:hypothetical protein